MAQFTETYSITLEAALELVRLGVEKGAEHGIKAVITVIDPSLLMVAFGKADGATPHSIETSRRKAATSASTRKATGWMQGDFATQAPLGTGLTLTNIRGGVPVTVDGRHIAGLGVAGGTPDQDAAVASAVLDTFGADPA